MKRTRSRSGAARNSANPKRAAILTAAAEVFFDAGYGAASMELIARKAQVSKQTVYSHFGGKAALFEAIISANCNRMLESLDGCGALPGGPDPADPAAVLETLAHRLLEIILAPSGLARFRVVMAESARFPELAEIYYRSGPERASARLAAYLRELHRDGVLDVPDPALAAGQFFGMVRGDLFLRGSLRVAAPAGENELSEIVSAAVRSFLRAYRPATAGRSTAGVPSSGTASGGLATADGPTAAGAYVADGGGGRRGGSPGGSRPHPGEYWDCPEGGTD